MAAWALYRFRLACLALLFLFSAAELSVSAVTLAFSVRAYRGSFLHATPELLGAGGVAFAVLLAAWFPRGRGRYGLGMLQCVGAEGAYTGVLALCFLGGVGSLHRATPGLLSSCGGFLVCDLYIGQMVLAWLCWLASASLSAGLVSSAVYQQYGRGRGRAVWARPVAGWEWYWPDERLPVSAGERRRHKRPSTSEPAEVELC